MLRLNSDPEDTDGPLYDLSERHSKAERLLDLAIAECIRRLEDPAEDRKKATLGDVVKLLSLYQRQIAPRAEAEMARQEAHKGVLRDLPTFDDGGDAQSSAPSYREPITFNPE